MNLRIAPLALLVSASLLAACGGDDEPSPASGGTSQSFGPLMRPGENCLSCHAENPVRSDAVGPSGRKATPWTAAGTVFTGPTSKEGLAGAKLTFTRPDGQEFSVTTNAVGNFYTDLPIDTKVGPRIEFQGRTAKMNQELPAIAACNGCHDDPPVGGAPGRIFVP
jgi:hypothetical protein